MVETRRLYSEDGGGMHLHLQQMRKGSPTIDHIFDKLLLDSVQLIDLLISFLNQSFDPHDLDALKMAIKYPSISPFEGMPRLIYFRLSREFLSGCLAFTFSFICLLYHKEDLGFTKVLDVVAHEDMNISLHEESEEYSVEAGDELTCHIAISNKRKISVPEMGMRGALALWVLGTTEEQEENNVVCLRSIERMFSGPFTSILPEHNILLLFFGLMLMFNLIMYAKKYFLNYMLDWVVFHLWFSAVSTYVDTCLCKRLKALKEEESRKFLSQYTQNQMKQQIGGLEESIRKLTYSRQFITHHSN
ncbi:hypothetical protein ACJX0J_022168, partial [Zea mays]